MNTPGSTSTLYGRLFLGACACISLYLASMALGRTALPGCEAGSACQDALESRWGFVFGIPVSFAGFLLYSFALLVSGAFVRRDRTLAGLQGGMAVSLIIAGAVWFTSLQIFALQALCVWCSITHACGIAGALFLCRSRRLHPSPATELFKSRREARNSFSNDRVFRFTATGAALAGTGMLALGALSGPLHRSHATSDPNILAAAAVRNGSIALHGGKFHVNPDEFPVIGHPAPWDRTAIFLSDYTCMRCRRTHVMLESLIGSTARAYRVVVMPAASSPEAEDVQRALLTVFHADRNKWKALLALVTSGQIPPERKIVEQTAIKLLGAEKWAETVHASAAQIDGQIRLAAAILAERHSGVSSPTLPQLMRDGRILAELAPDRAQLAAFLSSEKSPEAPAGGKAAGPSLFVVDSRVTLEDLEPGVPRDFQVQVRNDGTMPLKLGWLALDADCEVTQRTEHAIEPGQSSTIGFRLTPPSYSTEFSRTLKIYSTASGEPGTVTIRGKAAATAVTGPPPVSPRPAVPIRSAPAKKHPRVFAP